MQRSGETVTPGTKSTRPPVSAQILTQCGPLFLVVGGALVLREPLSRLQAGGVLVLIIGMGLFFNLPGFGFSLSGGLGIGHLMAVLAAVGWAVYALAQRRLISKVAPTRSLLLFYAAIGLLLLPGSRRCVP
jgi:drug/metabolite transporter (DMT)-like permease